MSKEIKLMVICVLSALCGVFLALAVIDCGELYATRWGAAIQVLICGGLSFAWCADLLKHDTEEKP